MIPCGFELGQMVIEETPGQECPCHICFLAAVKGGSQKASIRKLSRSDEVEQNADMRRCNFCFEAICGTQAESHICGGKAKFEECTPPQKQEQRFL